MTRPAAGAVTDRVYDRLPELYRDADQSLTRVQGYGEAGTYGQAGASYGRLGDLVASYPLLRYLGLLLGQLSPVELLRDRFTFTAPEDRQTAPQTFGSGSYGARTYGDLDTADLVDPMMADAAWLPWLAQAVGVTIPAGEAVTATRLRLSTPAVAWAHGTPDAIVAAVRPFLTGGRYVDVRPHDLGRPFVIGVYTKRAETNSVTTFAQLPSIATTFAELALVGDFSNLEAGGAIMAAATEKPAGYRLEHRYLEDAQAVG